MVAAILGPSDLGQKERVANDYSVTESSTGGRMSRYDNHNLEYRGRHNGVYVSVNNRAESLFARSPQSSLAANWIQTGFTYQFRLYDGPERGKLLAETTVTRGE